MNWIPINLNKIKITPLLSISKEAFNFKIKYKTTSNFSFKIAKIKGVVELI